MKKIIIDFESRFWCGEKKHSPLPLMEVFFQFHDLVTAKERLNLIMQYAAKPKSGFWKNLPLSFIFISRSGRLFGQDIALEAKAKNG
ncbi:hypothetical protein [Chryseobacterium gambrini]|uniref:hypothetical protein n=1 Tax=Chryseobacterium gambrini TaxID=373672 RepID=UPI0011159755|nr:hypothetical protein [Chryseobacterium gambrini]